MEIQEPQGVRPRLRVPVDRNSFSVPEGRAVRQNLVFDHIPDLKELLPKHRGIPGMVYAQITHHNARVMQDSGWAPLEDALMYTIIGPLGGVDMHLMVTGERIGGQSPDSGARLCLVDGLVSRITGHGIPDLETGDTYHWVDPTPEPVQEPEPTPEPMTAAQHPDYDRVAREADTNDDPPEEVEESAQSYPPQRRRGRPPKIQPTGGQ